MLTKKHFYFYAASILIFWNLISGYNSVYGQDTVFNSSISKDTVYVTSLFDSANVHLDNFDKGVGFVKEARGISKKIGYKKGIALSYIQSGHIYQNKDKQRDAISDFNTALILLREINLYSEIAKTYKLIGVSYYLLSKYSESISYLEIGLEISDSIGDNDEKPGIILNMGLAYCELGMYEKSLIKLMNAYDLFSEIDNHVGLSDATNAIGVLYFTIEDYDKANKYFHESLALYIESENEYGISNSLTNIGAVFYYKNQHDSAFIYLNKALVIDRKRGDQYGICLSIFNIGNLYKETGKTSNARIYILESLQIAKEINNNSMIGACYSQLASLDLEAKSYYSAAHYALLGLDLSKQVDNPKEILNDYELLDEIYTQSGQHQKAHNCLVEIMQLNDSVFTIEKNKQFLELGAKYDDKEQKLKIESLKKESKYHKERKTILGYIVIGSSLFVIILLILVFNIKKSGVKLRKQQKDLEKSNKTKDKILNIIGHDLLGPIGTSKGMVDIIVSEKDNLSKEDIIKLASSLKPPMDSTYSLVENLLAWARIQRDSIYHNPEPAYIKPIVDENFSLYGVQAESKQIYLKVKGDEALSANFDMTQITIVIRNLISNAIKFSNIGGEVIVNLSKTKDFAEISVSDSGIGMSQEQIAEIENGSDKITSRYGTDNEKGTGLGLVVVFEFVILNKGTIKIDSKEGKGSTFTFTLPLIKE
ncbi:MAG: hypothetical protein DRJ05_08105 [Bacteroidetes bacterium]|nr:MAG: hypothetical protein DRJ05_08105 [Bacteroidota bacterium]